jgi:hypothetical protein
VSNDQIASGGMAGVARDATSLKYVPSTAAQWTQTLAAAGISASGPAWGWGFQDASGNPAPFLGADSLTASGTGITYQSPVSGWSRAGLATADGATGAFVSTAGDLPSYGTTSMTTLAYIAFGAAPPSQRELFFQGVTPTELRYATTGKFLIVAGNQVNGNNLVANGVHPIILQHDHTNAVDNGYSDSEKLVAVAIGGAGQKLILGNTGARFASPITYLYMVTFGGTAAEMTATQIKSLLQVLGWTVLWS